MPFGMWGGVGPSNHVLDVGPDPRWGRGNFGVLVVIITAQGPTGGTNF